MESEKFEIKQKVYNDLMEIDSFEFNDLTSFDPLVLSGLKKLKKRHWLFIVYPESSPENWIEQMKLTGVQFAVSPLHDKDRTITGELKKPHYHVIVIFDGPTTFLTASSFRAITKGPYPKVCEGLRGAYEYLTHMNEPDKEKYDSDKIQLFNGFEIDLSKKDVTRIKKELVHIIIKENITEYMQFILYVLYNMEAEYYSVAMNDTYYFNTLITSFRNSPKKSKSMYERHIKSGEIQNKEKDLTEKVSD